MICVLISSTTVCIFEIRKLKFGIKLTNLCSLSHWLKNFLAFLIREWCRILVELDHLDQDYLDSHLSLWSRSLCECGSLLCNSVSRCRRSKSFLKLQIDACCWWRVVHRVSHQPWYSSFVISWLRFFLCSWGAHHTLELQIHYTCTCHRLCHKLCNADFPLQVGRIRSC